MMRQVRDDSFAKLHMRNMTHVLNYFYQILIGLCSLHMKVLRVGLCALVLASIPLTGEIFLFFTFKWLYSVTYHVGQTFADQWSGNIGRASSRRQRNVAARGTCIAWWSILIAEIR